MQYILASKSPRRKELFSLIVPEFRCETAQVDERSVTITKPDELCLELAKLKCRAIFRQHPDCCVIGSDTMVAVDGQLLGKPADREDELRMLRLLSGRRHEVYTGVHICAPGVDSGFVCCTGVYFLPLSEAEMAAYADTDDPYDKAGGYGVQSGAAKFCEKLDGCYFNVMGLPVSALYVKLRDLGLI